MISYWNYLGDYGRRREEILRIVDRVFSSGRLILGGEVESFEKRFSSFCGVPFGVGVNSGTDALFLGLKALGVGDGDEVITVANTAVPTVAAIRATGATPVFVDVEEKTYLMDASLIRPAITGKTKCVLPVHLFGQAADMDAIAAVAAPAGLRVLEDCAQAAGALYRGRPVGGIGDVGAFSFYPTKILGAFGDAGMVVTKDEGLYRKVRRLRFYGMEQAYYSEEEGYNSRLDEVQAALLSFALSNLKEAVRKRRELAARYSEGLRGIGDVGLPEVCEDRTHQFYAYTISTGRRDELMRFLKECGIETKINYPAPVHVMRGYAFLGYRPGDLPVTEKMAARMLSLPLFPDLLPAEVDEVVDRITAFFRTGGRRGRA